MVYHLLKVKSKDKIPDFIQIRDWDFVLKGYHRLDRPLKNPDSYGLEGKEASFWAYVHALPFDKVVKVKLPDEIER